MVPAANLRHLSVVQVLTPSASRHRPGPDWGPVPGDRTRRPPAAAADRPRPGHGDRAGVGRLPDLDLRRQRRPDAAGGDVGRAAGRLACRGPIMGFGTGLLVDTVLVQTLGVTSLLYIAIGYWSGRLRELRDPAHGLVPLAAGAAATAVAGLGMSLIQFLLGVDAPGQPAAAAADLHHRAGQHADRAARLRARAAHRPAGAARRSPPPAPPRLHDRGPQPAAEPFQRLGQITRGSR